MKRISQLDVTELADALDASATKGRESLECLLGFWLSNWMNTFVFTHRGDTRRASGLYGAGCKGGRRKGGGCP